MIRGGTTEKALFSDWRESCCYGIAFKLKWVGAAHWHRLSHSDTPRLHHKTKTSLISSNCLSPTRNHRLDRCNLSDSLKECVYVVVYIVTDLSSEGVNSENQKGRMCGQSRRMAEQMMKRSPRGGKKKKKQNAAQNSKRCVKCCFILNLCLFTSSRFKYLNVCSTMNNFPCSPWSRKILLKRLESYMCFAYWRPPPPVRACYATARCSVFPPSCSEVQKIIWKADKTEDWV